MTRNNSEVCDHIIYSGIASSLDEAAVYCSAIAADLVGKKRYIKSGIGPADKNGARACCVIGRNDKIPEIPGDLPKNTPDDVKRGFEDYRP